MSTRTQSVEEYLEAIFKLQRGQDSVTVTRLAAELGVAPPSVSEMLRRLRADGLVAEPAEGKGITLTTDGETEGAILVRRHRLSERFLVDYLDMPWDAVHEEACKLEHVLSPEVEARLAEQLGNPRTCPHGHTIPGEDGTLPDDPVLHTCVLAYLSDMTLLDTTLLPHGRGGWTEGDIMMASLDHAMWFHRPFRADEWLLYTQDTPSTSGARGLARGSIFT
ncbi:MAG: thioesterase family protein, partial [Thermoleophilia bacterium]|nr:thioesterase family protein [Thermoleophilia bacterium]